MGGHWRRLLADTYRPLVKVGLQQLIGNFAMFVKYWACKELAAGQKTSAPMFLLVLLTFESVVVVSPDQFNSYISKYL